MAKRSSSSSRIATPLGGAKKDAGSRKSDAGEGVVVAITGAFGFLGRKLIHLLEEDPRVKKIVALDVRSPVELALREGEPVDAASLLTSHPLISAHTVDLTDEGSDDELQEIFRRESVDTLVHLAFLSGPTQAVEFAHELETIGTLYALHAAAATGVRRLVVMSTTMAYGARGDNPAMLTENHALRGKRSAPFVADKVDADQQVQSFSERHPQIGTALLRLAPLVGGGARNFWTRTLTKKAIPTVLGHDPMLQTLHPEDAARSLQLACFSKAKGVFNVVGDGVLPLSKILKITGAKRLPLPMRMGTLVMNTLYSTQLMQMPASLRDYLRWGFVADGAKAKKELHFDAKHDVNSCLESACSTPFGGRGRVDGFSETGEQQ
ncbi:MAG: NAD-dependent epimerase/dehydratase family protein [Deltaproteobacteria bacterium]|nr:NAD-dependent epimerase/dehydratase family protein [Deltaproteobacteria bacterium]